MIPSQDTLRVLADAVGGAELRTYSTRPIAEDDALDHAEVVLYHKGCADGFCAAWAVHSARKLDADARKIAVLFLPIMYGKTEDVITPMLVHLGGMKVDLDIVDFSLPLHQFEELMPIANSVVYLDHHKGAADLLDDSRAMAVHHQVPQYVRFDNERSGAMMAWSYWFEEKYIPEVVWHVQDRDLWQFKLPATREIAAALYSYPMDMDTWDAVGGEHEKLAWEGTAILRAHNKNVASLTADWNVQRGVLYGIPAMRLAIPYMMASDAGHKLLDENPDVDVVVLVWQSADEIKLSFRSRKGGVDVAELAKKFGGGGHVSAAGANMSFSKAEDVALMQKYIANFEVTK